MKRGIRVKHVGRLTNAVLCLVILGTIAPGPAAAAGSADEVTVLVLMSDRHGAYFSYVRDQMELYGWDFTFAGVTDSVSNCYWGEPFTVDTLVSELGDVSGYDCLLIAQSQAYLGQANEQLLSSPAALDLVRRAVGDSLLVVAICGGTRVLAAADVIEGRQVTGYATYSQEYINAGAVWMGEAVPPVLDGNILTSSKGHYYSHQICEAMRSAVDSLRVARGRR